MTEALTPGQVFNWIMVELHDLEKRGAYWYESVPYKRDPEFIKKYEGKEGHLPSKDWVKIKIRPMGDTTWDDLFALEERIRQEGGCSFDTGMGGGCRDWCLDFSFRVDTSLTLN